MNIPRSTYRLQFSHAFGFNDARRILGYLSDLGISAVYASPVFKAKQGSTHGYNVTDQNLLNPELGAPGEFDALCRECGARGIGWLQDIVPNHMAYDGENRIIMDVLEHGPLSRYRGFFDVDWDYPYENMKGRLLAPFLGRFYGECLESGEIRLVFDEQGLSVAYYDLKFPLSLQSYVKVFSHELSELRRRLGPDDPDFIEFLGILYSFKNFAQRGESARQSSDLATAKMMLWKLAAKNAEIRKTIDGNIALLNGTAGRPDSFNALDRLLSEQNFRLSFWKVASEELNYRRFFTIKELISLKVEEDFVFEHIHELLWRLVGAGAVTGLRVDHIDGLYDPTKYLRKLAERSGDTYLLVEKILGQEEELPASWPVHGTTGYDFIARVTGIFCRTENAEQFDVLYREFSGSTAEYKNLVLEKRRLIIGKYMAGDVDRLARIIKDMSSRDRQGSDITLYGLKRALVEVLAHFPFYRTYVNLENYAETDRSTLSDTLAKAKELNPLYIHELRFIEKFLLLDYNDYLNEEEKKKWTQFVMRFQQFTAPLMAKGFEDTVLYVYNRFLALNEVGVDPGVFGITSADFHGFNEKRSELYPHSLSATATHDTKRGEDVRARLCVLSEIPGEWARRVRRWSRVNRRAKRFVRGQELPAKNDEYSLYQSLVGHFPFSDRQYYDFTKRVKEYAIKAVREAKVYTAWLKPDSEYEDAFLGFIDDILTPVLENRFLCDFLPFQKKIARYGIFNSLAQTLLKITAPGVPDFYQGTELWDLSFVDPDNRRPVDFAKRRSMLDGILSAGEANLIPLAGELLGRREDGQVKLFLIQRALRARNRAKEVFEKGSYLPIEAVGVLKDNVVAFARVLGERWAITVVPRFPVSLVSEDDCPLGDRVWGTTQLVVPPHISRWTDAVAGTILAGGITLPVGEVLKHFPAALLMNI